jgi:aminopeptidase N
MKYLKIILPFLIFAAAAAAYTEPPTYDPPPAEFYYGNLFDAKESAPLPARAQHNYDVRKYTIRMDIDDANTDVDAVTTVRLESKESSLTSFELDFTDDLTVTSVKRGATSLTFTHQNDLLRITLDRAMSNGERFDVDVAYNGKPGYGFFFTTGGVFTSTECSYSRNWFPCFDEPSDKADDGIELYITVRDDWYVASNGLLATTSRVDADSLEYHWIHNYSIATYLVAIACADYNTSFNQTWEGMPVNYYVYDSQIGAAPTFFENQKDMLDCYAAKFCDYPFKNEKYGVAAVNMTNFGGMENQTCTYIRSSYVTPNHNGDHLLAHELGHSWWGDMVTCGTWKDLWLNEGQATYCE